MHRYRDALIYFSKYQSNQERGNLSRPVFGAFALYPGFFNQHASSNPYNETIEKVGIGAFALLPSSDLSSGNEWLKIYLKSLIGPPAQPLKPNFTNEELSLQNPSRIPMSGMFQNFYRNLVLISIINSSSLKNTQSASLSKDGNPEEYRISSRLFKDEVDTHILDELKFIGIAGDGLSDKPIVSIDAIWSVKSVEFKTSSPINKEGSLCEEFSEPFWVITLGQRLELKNKIENIPLQNKLGQIKLTTLDLIKEIKDYENIPEVYMGRVSSFLN